MFDKFKNARRKEVVEVSLPRNELSEDEVREILEYFKTCVVSKDSDRIKQKLMETVSFRRQFFGRVVD